MNVPKLRFTEFRDVWFEIRLGDECDVRDGTHDSPKYVEKGFPLVTSKNLMDGEIDLENVSFISVEDYEKINQRSKVNVGDIIFGMIGTIGNPVLLKSNQFAIKNVALFKEKISSRIKNIYLIQYLNSNSFIKVTNYLHAGNTQKFVSLGALRGLEFQIPSLIEQTKIATFLSAVDEKIAQLSRKHELLQQYKQGMMQQLFSQKLRFKDDKGEDFPEWEEKLLGNICSNFQSGKSITSDEIFEVGKYPVYGGNGLRGFTSSYTHEGTFVLIGRQGALCGNINLVNQKNFVSEHAIAVQAQKSFSNEWLAQLLTWMNLGRFSESSAQAGLAVNKLIKFKICCPTKLEQTKIANFLNAIDNKIDVITNQIQQAREWKQGLLQQMFV